MKKLDQKGSHLVAAVLGLVVLGVVGFVGWRIMNGNGKDKATTSDSTANSSVTWSFEDEVWKSSGTPPACPATLTAPVDITKATAILYPGQTRGGNYKAHSGFIFKNSTNNEITVSAPIDANLVKGSRYIEQGETQYLLIFVAPCGLMYRFDHLLTLSSKYQTIVDKFPPAQKDDSRTTNVDPAVKAIKGEVIATAVGFKNTNNVSVDFGVYNLNAPNEASKDAAYAAKYGEFKETNFYGVCWLDMLEESVKTTAKALPGGDGVSGKKSDYCK